MKLRQLSSDPLLKKFEMGNAMITLLGDDIGMIFIIDCDTVKCDTKHTLSVRYLSVGEQIIYDNCLIFDILSAS